MAEQKPIIAEIGVQVHGTNTFVCCKRASGFAIMPTEWHDTFNKSDFYIPVNKWVLMEDIKPSAAAWLQLSKRVQEYLNSVIAVANDFRDKYALDPGKVIVIFKEQ